MNNSIAIASVVIREMIRRKDFYVLFVLTVLITLVMGSVSFFNDGKIIRYLKEICLMLIWISSLVIAISTMARQLPSERENRTIFPLLAKPVSRTEVLIGKFLGCWLACGVALLLFYVFFGCVAMTREKTWPFINYFQAFWLHWIMLSVVVAMALLGSILFSAASANATICFVAVVGILMLARHLNKVALQMTEPLRTVTQAIYFTIPHLEFFDVRDSSSTTGRPSTGWCAPKPRRMRSSMPPCSLPRRARCSGARR
jgi:Cu-processing system permease protein